MLEVRAFHFKGAVFCDKCISAGLNRRIKLNPFLACATVNYSIKFCLSQKHSAAVLTAICKYCASAPSIASSSLR